MYNENDMKKIILSIILALAALTADAQVDLIGSWTGKPGQPNEYRQIEETISPEVLSDIAEWINRLK